MAPRKGIALRFVAPLAAVATIALVGIAACGGAPSDSRIGVTVPDRSQFPPVSDVLDHRCGSLDCHGNRQRNMIVYGCEGLRLDPADAPGCRASGGKNTTVAEYDATFRSLVGLEPAVMSSVVAGKGADPELLTFVRKARGTEGHKGGQLFTAGDPQDTCVTTWLGGKTNTDACTAALTGTP